MDIIPLVYSVFIVFFPLICIFCFTPLMWKRGSAFGISLPKELYNSTEIKQLCRQYSFFVLIAGLSLGATTVITGEYFALPVCSVVYIILSLAIFAVNSKLIKNIIVVNNYENIDKPVYLKLQTEEFKVNTISFLWLLILIIPAAVSFYIEHKFKTVISYALPVIQIVIIALNIVGFILIKKTKQYVNKHTAQEDIKRNIKIRKQLSVLIFALSLIISTALTILQLCVSKIITEGTFIVLVPGVTAFIVTSLIIIFSIRLNK